MSTLVYFSPALLHGFVGSFLLFLGLWFIQVYRKNAGVVDIGWTLGVGGMALYVALIGEGWALRRILLGAMGGIWAFRLVGYILRDRILGRPEDSRYRRLRARWGRHANHWFLLFFTSQSLLVVLFALPFLPAARKTTASFGLTDALAVLLWLASMAGEWLADYQLARFRKNPANSGRVCETGLWNWSRHPNYFFEWLHWFSYVLLGFGAAGFGLTLIGPVAMYLFLMKVTGIPHVERESLAHRGDAYRRYQQTTSILIPMPKRKRA